MKVIVLDGSRMTSKEEAHKYLKETLKLPDYYGENLDAFWDVMSTYSDPITILLKNETEVYKNLDVYGEQLIGILQDASCENSNILLSYMEEDDAKL